MGRPPAGTELTARYLERVIQQRLSASDLTAGISRSAALADDPFLSRPTFLSAEECQRLHADVELLYQALASMPERLYDGDVAAFAKDAGLSGPQIDSVIRGGPTTRTALARADLYQEASGFRLLEVNVGSAVAGVGNGDICDALLEHPALASFAAENHLVCPDSMRLLTDLIVSETGHAPQSPPSVAIIAWPKQLPDLVDELSKVAWRWQAMGLDTQVGHLGELEFSGGRVWLRGHPVDVIFRLFVLEHLLAPGGQELIDPVLAAAERGEVGLFTPLESEMCGSKMSLAMLCDPANQGKFTSAELAAARRLLPWTAAVKPGPVTLEDGQEVDLLDYAADHADDLVLKPALLHGGLGVQPGWDPGLTEQAWRDAIASAMHGPYVLQRRSRPLLDLFPGDGGELVPWVVTWGVFTIGGQYGGTWTRAFPERSGQLVQLVGTGAHLGACLHAEIAGG